MFAFHFFEKPTDNGLLLLNNQIVKQVNFVTDLKISTRNNLKLDCHLPKKFFICFNDSPIKIMKNDFYFILKVLFVLKIFELLS